MAGVVIRDPATGRIVGTRSRSLFERYPTGRKNCGRCSRWRHLVDFSPNGQYIQSWCRVCRQRYTRRGDRPRQPLNHHELLAYKKAEWAKYIEKIKDDPERHQEYLETQRIRQHDWRRKKGIPVRRRKTKSDPRGTYVDATLFLEWLHWNPAAAASATSVEHDETEGRAIRRAKKTKRISLAIADSILSRAGHHDQLSVLCPPDDDINKKGRPRGSSRQRQRSKSNSNSGT